MRPLPAWPLLAALLALATSLAGCNDKQDRFEDIDKVRALGVGVTPIATNADPTKTWKLTAYVAVPKGATVTTAEAYDDPSDPQGTPKAKLTVDPASVGAACETHKKFDICNVTASAPVPPPEQVLIRDDVGFARLRYGVRIVAGGQEQTIIGALLIFPADSPHLKDPAPTIDITTPAANAAVSGKPDLKASLNASNDENFRIGWFTSGGNIDNRRAAETTWSKLPDAGDATLVVTARGLATGAFSFKAVDVTVQ